MRRGRGQLFPGAAVQALVPLGSFCFLLPSVESSFHPEHAAPALNLILNLIPKANDSSKGTATWRSFGCDTLNATIQFLLKTGEKKLPFIQNLTLCCEVFVPHRPRVPLQYGEEDSRYRSVQ